MKVGDLVVVHCDLTSCQGFCGEVCESLRKS